MNEPRKRYREPDPVDNSAMPESLFDVMKVQQKPEEKEESIQDKMKKESTTRSLLAGATPLLVGFLSGNMEDGIKVAGDALVEEQARADKKDESLLDYLRTQRKLSSASDRVVEYVDPETGETKWGYARDVIGSRTPDKRRPKEEVLEIKQGVNEIDRSFGKHTTKSKDPLTDQEYLVDKGTNITRKIEYSDPATEFPPEWTKPKEELTRKNVELYTKASTKAADGIINLQKGLASINEGGLGEKIGVMSLIKDIESRLSDYDREFYKDPEGIWHKTVARLETEKSGRLRKELIKEAKTLLETAFERAKTYGDFVRKRSLDQMEAAGIPRSYANKRLGGQFKPRSIPKKEKKKVFKNKDEYEAYLKTLSDEEFKKEIGEK